VSAAVEPQVAAPDVRQLVHEQRLDVGVLGARRQRDDRVHQAAHAGARHVGRQHDARDAAQAQPVRGARGERLHPRRRRLAAHDGARGLPPAQRDGQRDEHADEPRREEQPVVGGRRLARSGRRAGASAGASHAPRLMGDDSVGGSTKRSAASSHSA
jgi:hypothetical protein